MAKGYTVEFLGRSIVFFPLTIGQIQELGEELKAMIGVSKGADPFDPKHFEKLITVYLASARRGNASITREEIKGIVDLANMRSVNSAVMGASGLEEVSSEGGATQANPTKTLTGG